MIEIDDSFQVWSEQNISEAYWITRAGFSKFFLVETGAGNEVVAVANNIPILDGVAKVDLSWNNTQETAIVKLDGKEIYFDNSEPIRRAIGADNFQLLVDAVERELMKKIVEDLIWASCDRLEGHAR
jgi:hypothetical protein